MTATTLFFLALLGAGTGWVVNWASEQFGANPEGAKPSAQWGWFAAAITAFYLPYFAAYSRWVNIPIALFFLLIALIDGKYRLIPNRLIYPALLLTLLGQFWFGHYSMIVILLGGGLAFSTFALVAWLRPGKLGGGDVKLAALIGCLFGFPDVLPPLLIGVTLGGIAAAILLHRGYNRHHQIPYAPFLCLGVFLALLWQ